MTNMSSSEKAAVLDAITRRSDDAAERRGRARRGLDRGASASGRVAEAARLRAGRLSDELVPCGRRTAW